MNLNYPRPFGPYELLRPLGRGGMAEVFLAQANTKEGEARLVALKRMHAGVSEDNSAVEMLIAEARLAMKFAHPNIASTFELGCHEGNYYIVMEYVNGIDVGSLASLAGALGEKPPLEVVAHTYVGIARGLHYAHTLKDEDDRALGIVHRDVSPQNVLIGKEAGIKLIDFGVAKVATRIQQTMAGVIKGKYAYMSPEQASAEQVDARSDIFSLGICMHELITGKPLFRGADLVSPFAILRAVRDEPIPLLHEVVDNIDAELSAIVSKALERSVESRYQSGGELADDLEGWLQSRATDVDEKALHAYVRDLVDRAPSEPIQDDVMETPAVATMMGYEFLPSPLSVIARSPLEPMTTGVDAPTRPSRKTSSQRLQRRPSGQPLAVRSHSTSAIPIANAQPTPTSARPSRKAVLQFLWVGLAALIFALGWSVIATLKQFGLI